MIQELVINIETVIMMNLFLVDYLTFKNLNLKTICFFKLNYFLLTTSFSLFTCNRISRALLFKIFVVTQYYNKNYNIALIMHTHS